MIRYLAVIALFVFLFSCPAYSQLPGLQGWCEDGGVSVVIPGTQGSGTQKFMQSFPSCTVTVKNAGTQTLATIYSDSAGVNPKANPFIASTTGQWYFYGSAVYDITFSGGGISAPFTRGGVGVSVGTGTPGTVPVWVGTTVLGNSSITDSGGNVAIGSWQGC